MALTNDLISQFVKATKDTEQKKTETTYYGTVKVQNGTTYVQLDGSELLTPAVATASTKDGERVIVTIKNHTAIITGNISSPAARVDDIEDVSDIVNKITEFEILIADKVSSDELEAEVARIDAVIADNVFIKNQLSAAEADIDNLQTNVLTVAGRLTAAEADITRIETEKLDVNIAVATYATITNLESTNATIHNLESTYAEFVITTTSDLIALEADIAELEANRVTTEYLESTYANIDFSNIDRVAMEYFYAQSGLIKDVQVGNATISGELVGVTFKGDLLEGNTVKADKLVIKGSDGLYYKLNTDGMVTEKEQTDQNSLNGKIIQVKSITASRISVEDLVAFDATIGGFEITEDSIYSGVKSSVDNTTRGTYMDKDGQVAFGDGNEFIKYYKDANGDYRLHISAKSLSIDGRDAISMVDDLRIGARNLLQKTNPSKWLSKWVKWSNTAIELVDDNWVKVSKPSGVSSYGCYPPNISTFPEVGDYTLSFEAYSPDGPISLAYNYIMGDSGNAKISSVTITTEPKRYVIPITTTKKYANSSIMLGSTQGTAFYIRNLKLEIGSKDTDYTEAPEDVAAEIEEAAKTASSFMSYDGTNGLQVGNKASGSWVGFRAQISNQAFRILNSAGTALASYGAKLIELGKNATDAVISFCGGKGQIEYDADAQYLQLTGDQVRVKGDSMSSLYSKSYDGANTARASSVNVSPDRVDIFAQTSTDIDPNTQTGTWKTSEASLTPDGLTVVADDVDVVSRGDMNFQTVGDGDIMFNGTTLLDLFYPVGSIYMSTVYFDPGTKFGGTWERLMDRFLLGSGAVYANGHTGGSATHTLTVQEMPEHQHVVGYQNTGAYVTLNSGSGTGNYNITWTANAGYASGDLVGLGTGGGQAHNNMPPYLVVNMWKRVK